MVPFGDIGLDPFGYLSQSSRGVRGADPFWIVSPQDHFHGFLQNNYSHPLYLDNSRGLRKLRTMVSGGRPPPPPAFSTEHGKSNWERCLDVFGIWIDTQFRRRPDLASGVFRDGVGAFPHILLFPRTDSHPYNSHGDFHGAGTPTAGLPDAEIKKSPCGSSLTQDILNTFLDYNQ